MPVVEKPWAMAAAVEVTFHVEPGAYSPWVARLRIGSPRAVPNRSRNSELEMPPVHTLGL